MSTLGDRLKSARNKKGISQKELAKKIGKSQSAIAAIESGRNKESTNIATLAQALDVDAMWLESGLGLPTNLRVNMLSEPSNVQPAHQVYSDVPLISWVQAGNWAEAIDLLQVGEGERIDTTYKPRRHTFALRVVNDSMSPEFAEGDIIVVEPDANAENGSYVVVRQNGNEATFKQLIKDGNHYYLKPLNKTYPMLEMNDDAVICGVVKEKIKRY